MNQYSPSNYSEQRNTLNSDEGSFRHNSGSIPKISITSENLLASTHDLGISLKGY